MAEVKGQVQTEKRRGGEEKKGVRKGRKGLIEKERSEKEWLEKGDYGRKGPKTSLQQADFLLWTGPVLDSEPFSRRGTECKLLTSVVSIHYSLTILKHVNFSAQLANSNIL